MKYSFKCFTNYREVKVDRTACLAGACLIASIALFIFASYRYTEFNEPGALITLFTASASLLSFFVLGAHQISSVREYKGDNLGEIEISRSGISLFGDYFANEDIVDFSLRVGYYKGYRIHRIRFYGRDFLWIYCILFKNKHNGISGNIMRIETTAFAKEFNFRLNSLREWSSMPSLIAHFASVGVLSETRATQTLRDCFGYNYSEIQEFKKLVSKKRLENITSPIGT